MDLNLNSYSKKDLLNIFEIEERTIDLEKLKTSLNHKITDIQNINEEDLPESRDSLLLFYTQAIFKLMEHCQLDMKDFNKQNKQNGDRKPDRKANQDIIYHRDAPYRLTNPSDIVGGEINALSRRVIKNVININSVFRLFDNNSYKVKNENLTKYNKENSSSNFIIRLPKALDKVVSMNLSTVEIPITFYVISSDLQTNVFTIILKIKENNELVKIPYTITIPDGNYTNIQILNIIQQNLDNTINEKLQEKDNHSYWKQFNMDLGNGPQNPNKIKVKRHEPTNQLIFYESLYFFYDGYQGFDLDFRITDNNRNIQQNLGWLLGFKKEYYLYEKDYINLDGYFYHSQNIDMQAALSGGTIDITNDPKFKNKYELGPNQKQFFYKNCSVKTYNDESNIYSPNLNYINQAEVKDVVIFPQGIISEAGMFLYNRYLFLLVNDFNNNVHNTYTSICFNNNEIPSSNILSRIETSTNHRLTQFADFKTGKREYFGPVKIEKLHIQVVDQFGRNINLNNNEISLVLEFEILYNL